MVKINKRLYLAPADISRISVEPGAVFWDVWVYTRNGKVTAFLSESFEDRQLAEDEAFLLACKVEKSLKGAT